MQVRHKWFDIGVQLNLDPEDLQKLMINGKLSDNDRLRNMCLDWLLGQEPVPSWRGLCAALRMPAVNEARLASVVEKERIFVDLEMSGVTPGLGGCGYGIMLFVHGRKGNYTTILVRAQ